MRGAPRNAPVDDDGTIPLPSREKFKFYEPVILLQALNTELRSTANYINPSEKCNIKDPEQLFKAFVNKLALVCDSSKGNLGATVTAIWVSEDEPGQVVYHVASNKRKVDELDAVASFVRTLLEQVRDADVHQPDRALLPPILRFNRPRINLYLDGLQAEGQKCLDKRAELGENEDLIVAELQRVVQMSSAERAARLSEPDYMNRCQDVFRRLQRAATSPAWTYIDDLGRDARSSSQKDCWSEFRHMASRLGAYPQAVAFFLLAKAEWPRLFKSFTVTPIPSSRPWQKLVVRNKSLTADSIVGRLTRREKEIAVFRSFVQDLQLFELDDRIRHEFTKDTFRPVVHAEILLLNHIEFSGGGITRGRFFGEWRYIGSSKPTCRLCHYYFTEHGSGVGHRATHNNLYDNWRLPDVREDSGPAALEGRTMMLDRMLAKVRSDAFDLVKKRAMPTHRSHDSVTSSARVTLEERWSTTSRAADDLASVMGELGL